MKYQILKILTLWTTGAYLYGLIEIAFRGYTHISMGILGGVCFIVIGEINFKFSNKMAVVIQMLISTIIITSLEYCTGIIVNVWMKLGIWDYSTMPFNLSGQICMMFSVAWFFLSFVGMLFYSIVRYAIFKEPFHPLFHLSFKFKKA